MSGSIMSVILVRMVFLMVGQPAFLLSSMHFWIIIAPVLFYLKIQTLSKYVLKSAKLNHLVLWLQPIQLHTQFLLVKIGLPNLLIPSHLVVAIASYILQLSKKLIRLPTTQMQSGQLLKALLRLLQSPIPSIIILK